MRVFCLIDGRGLAAQARTAPRTAHFRVAWWLPDERQKEISLIRNRTVEFLLFSEKEGQLLSICVYLVENVASVGMEKPLIAKIFVA